MFCLRNVFELIYVLALLNGVRKMSPVFGSLANLHSIENWELVCLAGTKLSFFGRKYSFTSDQIGSFCAKITVSLRGQGTSHSSALWGHCTAVHVGGREYSFICDVQKSKSQFHYGDKVQVIHLHCGDIVLQYM